MLSQSLKLRIIDWPDSPPREKQWLLINGYMPKWRQFSWHDIDELEKLGIIDGCGGKGGRMKPPKLRFRASCNQHDWNYYLGGTEEDRLQADQQFFLAMCSDVLRVRWYGWPIHLTAAVFYYMAVRRHGRKFFTYWEASE